MGAMSDGDRNIVTHDFGEGVSRIFEDCAVTKTELRAAVNATDDWIDSNAGSYNSALPAAAESGLTAKQKARLFLAVAARRFDLTNGL